MLVQRKEQASPDYERPQENVADMPDPVTLPAIKARQGETSGHMRVVLTVGIALAILAFVFGYLVTS
ncbi:MAG: hypothetical protein WD871_09965 [Xanthobacteraceae bacterium]